MNWYLADKSCRSFINCCILLDTTAVYGQKKEWVHQSVTGRYTWAVSLISGPVLGWWIFITPFLWEAPPTTIVWMCPSSHVFFYLILNLKKKNIYFQFPRDLSRWSPPGMSWFITPMDYTMLYPHKTNSLRRTLHRLRYAIATGPRGPPSFLVSPV